MIHGWHGPETLPTTTMPKLNSLIFVTPNYGETDIGGLATSARRIVRHLASAYPVTVVTPTELMPAFTYRVLDAEPARMKPLCGVIRDGHNPELIGYCRVWLDALQEGYCSQYPIGMGKAR